MAPVTNDERPSEVALGQASTRDANEGLASTSLELDPSVSTLRILCECGRSDCETRLDVSQEVYRRVRQRPNRFLVAAGHEVDEVDRVAQRLGNLTITESRYIGDARLPGA
jgi:hypothetical protein